MNKKIDFSLEAPRTVNLLFNLLSMIRHCVVASALLLLFLNRDFESGIKKFEQRVAGAELDNFCWNIMENHNGDFWKISEISRKTKIRKRYWNVQCPVYLNTRARMQKCGKFFIIDQGLENNLLCLCVHVYKSKRFP